MHTREYSPLPKGAALLISSHTSSFPAQVAGSIRQFNSLRYRTEPADDDTYLKDWPAKLGNPVLVTEGRVTVIDGLLACAVLLGLVLNLALG